MPKEDRMDSFFLSETLKYLYLLFTEISDLPINTKNFIFTTEGHLLPKGLKYYNDTDYDLKQKVEWLNNDFYF